MKMIHCYLMKEMDLECLPGECCPRCKMHLHTKGASQYDLPFCWECITSKTNAQRGRTLMAKIRLGMLPLQVFTFAVVLLTSTLYADESVLAVIGHSHVIERAVPHMYGEEDIRVVSAGRDALFLTGASISYDASDSRNATNSVLCHAFVYDAPYHRRPAVCCASDKSGLKMVISQGRTSMHFPEGFGIPLKEKQGLTLFSMAADPVFSGKSYRVKPTMTLSTSNEPLKKLHLEWFSKDVTQLPPGLHVFKSDVFHPQSDARLHFANIHVHSYAQSIEMRDLTDSRRMYRFAVKTAPNGTVLETAVFSSVEGIPFFRNHTYQLVVTYNNRSSHAIDTMASVFCYFSPVTVVYK